MKRVNFVSPEMEAQLRSSAWVTPSAINPWYGTWSEGAIYTGQQLRELARLGIDAETADRIEVHVKVTAREMWWPVENGTPTRRVPCPIVGRRNDRLKVISPAGKGKFVYADGLLTRPPARRVGRGFDGR